ncbi:trypsin-like peptidase domain-containing protein [Georgenia sp. MJ173]|uniref:S1C family serine protease n=1 Tax=Georgenia sunbinii TaxID=3117728 RepID=UPI002F269CDB
MTERRDEFADDPRTGHDGGAEYPPAPAPEPEPYSAPAEEAERWSPTPEPVVAPAPEQPEPEQPVPGAPSAGPRDRDGWAADENRSPSPYAGWATAAPRAAVPPAAGSSAAGSPTSGSSTAGWPTGGSPTAPPQPLTSYPPSTTPRDFAPGDYAAAPTQAFPWADVRGHGAPHEHDPQQQPALRPRKQRRERRQVSLAVVVLLVLVALLAGLVGGALGGRELFASQSPSLPTSAAGVPVDRAPESVAAIAAAALESTVFIQVFGDSAASSGSGMVLREDGYIVTNAHVVAAAGESGRVTVTFADGAEEPAEIVGRTVEYDLAVLHVDRDGLVPLVLADSSTVVVGDPAVAVGAPLGLEGTVTTGIISALNRPVQAGGSGDGQSAFINAIQTDAAINPGNSGGPLLNLGGEVVGINTAIAQTAGRETGSIGLGFAIPSDQVRRTAEQIIEQGQATYPVIGVALDTQYQGEGVRVLEQDTGGTEAVTSGGPSDVAGIEAGDLITRVDDAPVTSPSELIVAVRARAPGETVRLTVRRDGSEREVDVVLGEQTSE